MSIKLQPIGFRLAVSQTWQFPIQLFNFKTALTRNSFLIRWIKYFCFRNKLYFFSLKFVYEDDFFLVLHFFFFFNFFFKKNYRFFSSNKHTFRIPYQKIRRRRKRLPRINKILHFRWLLNFLFLRKILPTRTRFLSSLLAQIKHQQQQNFNFFRSGHYNLLTAWSSLILPQPGSYNQMINDPLIGNYGGTWQWKNGFPRTSEKLLALRSKVGTLKKAHLKIGDLKPKSLPVFGNYRQFFGTKTVDEIRALRKQKLKKKHFFSPVQQPSKRKKSPTGRWSNFKFKSKKEKNMLPGGSRVADGNVPQKKLSWLSLLVAYRLRKRFPYNYRSRPSYVGSKGRFTVSYVKTYYYPSRSHRKDLLFRAKRRRILSMARLPHFRVSFRPRRLGRQKVLSKKKSGPRKKRKQIFGYYLCLNAKARSRFQVHPVVRGLATEFSLRYIQRKRYVKPLFGQLKTNIFPLPPGGNTHLPRIQKGSSLSAEKKGKKKPFLTYKTFTKNSWRSHTSFLTKVRSTISIHEKAFRYNKSGTKFLYLSKKVKKDKTFKNWRSRALAKAKPRGLPFVKKLYMRAAHLHVFKSSRLRSLQFFRRRRKMKKMIAPYLFATRHAWLFLLRRQILKKQEFFRKISVKSLQHRRVLFKLQTLLSGPAMANYKKRMVSTRHLGFNVPFLFFKRQLLLMLPFQNIQKRLLHFSFLSSTEKQQLRPKITRGQLTSLFKFCKNKEVKFKKLWTTRSLTLLQRKAFYSLHSNLLTLMSNRESAGTKTFMNRRLLRMWSFGSTQLHDYIYPRSSLSVTKNYTLVRPIFISWKYFERIRLLRVRPPLPVEHVKLKPLRDRYRKRYGLTIEDSKSEANFLSQSLLYRLCLLRYLKFRRNKNVLRKSNQLWMRHQGLHYRVGRILRYRLLLMRLQHYLAKKFLIFCRKRAFFFLQNAAEMFWRPIKETKKQRSFNNLHLIGAIRLKNDILMYSGQAFHSRYAFLVYSAAYFGQYHVLFQWMQYYLPRVRKLSVTFSHKKMFRFFALGIENLMFSLGLIQGYHFEVLGKIDGSTRPKKFIQGSGIPVRRHDFYASFFYYTLDLSTYAGVLRMRLWILP